MQKLDGAGTARWSKYVNMHFHKTIPLQDVLSMLPSLADATNGKAVEKPNRTHGSVSKAQCSDRESQGALDVHDLTSDSWQKRPRVHCPCKRPGWQSHDDTNLGH